MDGLYLSSYFEVSNPFTNYLVTVPIALITIGITVTFMFSRLFYSQARSKYLSLFSLSFSFTQWSTGTAKFTIRQVLFFNWLSLGLVVWPRLGDPFVSENPKELCASHFLGRILGCAYTISNSNFVHISQFSRTNSSVKDMNCYSTYAVICFFVAKVCVEPSIFIWMSW